MNLVLKARAKLRDNKVNGPEDAIVNYDESSCGWTKGARTREETAYLWIRWDMLPRLASDDDECDTEALGVAGRKESRDETRDGGKTNTVTGELGYQDGFR